MAQRTNGVRVVCVGVGHRNLYVSLAAQTWGRFFELLPVLVLTACFQSALVTADFYLSYLLRTQSCFSSTSSTSACFVTVSNHLSSGGEGENRVAFSALFSAY